MVSDSNGSESVFDAVICGRGLIGTAVAVALQRGGLRVALLEVANPPPTPATPVAGQGLDRRTTAVAAASREWLRANGLWRQAGVQGGDIAAIRVSDRQSRLFLDFDPAAIGNTKAESPLPTTLGTIALNRSLLADFNQAVGETTAESSAESSNKSPAETPAESSAAITQLTVRQILGMDRGLAAPALVRLRLQPMTTDPGVDSGAEFAISTHLIVAADGKNSPLRERLGIDCWRWDYGQTALVCTIAHEHPHQNIAHERFLAGGPLAVLPLGDPHQSSVVWTEPTAVAAEIAGLSPLAIAEEFWARFGSSLGRIKILDEVKIWPLQFLLARRLVGDRLVLVGDAAHLLHPIAGQGANLGWRDCAQLARLVIDAKKQGLDLGSRLLLERYESQRWLDSLSLALVTNGLNRLFVSQAPGLAVMRDLGLGLVNHLPKLKRPMMLQAMGLGPQQ